MESCCLFVIKNIETKLQIINLLSLVLITCDENTYYCANENSKCIPWLWVCDGDADCDNGSDEATELCGLFSNLSIPDKFLLLLQANYSKIS